MRRYQMAAHAGLVSRTITVWRAAQGENRQRWTAPSFPRKATGVVHQLSARLHQHLSIGFLVQIQSAGPSQSRSRLLLSTPEGRELAARQIELLADWRLLGRNL